MAQIRYWIWLTTVQGLSLRSQFKLLQRFQTPENVFLADHEALRQSGILNQKEITALESRDLRRADRVLEDCRRENIRILTIQDAAYPERLKVIDMPPLVLYYKGNFLPFDALPAVTVVGARDCSGYGSVMAKRLGVQLAACGGILVSGAARGIDSLALSGALSTGAPVAAVLGNGLDIVYPYEARRVYEDVAKQGCLISEYIPGTKPLGTNFPRRNRIMSGLSLGVVVVEARKQSGSLITADFALEQGRDVFAVPGCVGQELSDGPNGLIQDGASLITCGWDVMQTYQGQFPYRIRHWKGGDRLSLSAKEQAYIRSLPMDSVEEPEETAMEPGESVPAEPVQPQPGAEKRIDNAEKRNYIEQQILDTLTPDEQTLIHILEQGQRHVDDIIAESGLSAARVLSSLTLLEVKGYVCQNPGKRFDLNSK